MNNKSLTKIKSLFPIFSHYPNLVYLDSAATSLKPVSVIQAIQTYYEKFSLNTHSEGSGLLAQKVRENIQETRKIIARSIKGSPEEIIFFPSATYALNILTQSLKSFLTPGDQIFLTRLEHSSNCYPWQNISQEKGTKTDFLPLNENFTIETSLLEQYINSKTKIVSFFHVSNSLGVINPVEKITHQIKKINPHCLVIIDACQSVSHGPLEVEKWGVDALVFSGHKVYGPTGIGVLWVKKELGRKLPDLLWGGGKKNGPLSLPKNYSLPFSQKFEVGTLPLAQIFGLKKSFEFLNSLDLKEVNTYEKELKDYTVRELTKLKKVVIYNKNLETGGIVLFNLIDYHTHDVVDYLGKNDIYVRAGNLCCPYLKEIIGVEAAIRVSVGIYNQQSDIDKLIYHIKLIIEKPELLFSL